ncbi:hypothetical protein M2436_007520 [Streptomyces sp. HB372]|uniref:hypothetical protein n=1 Tax=Streptomyces anulatus TaxID=1892 RepID=UPI00363D0F3F|nr:hypothetical protein [Streptomyces sp. HB372]
MASAQGRLLVVDFDFFFHNPFEGLPAPHRGHESLYDWAHEETPLLTEFIWPVRGEEFLSAGVVPPRCEGYQDFWDRFTFTSDSPPMFYADSNLYAGHLTPRHFALFSLAVGAWEEVHLFDAHHDSGYPHEKGPSSFEQWKELGEFSCEDWMLVHHDRGSRLTHTYPAWRPDGDSHPPMVPLRTTVDDGRKMSTVFDAVFLCRSGAWVPSWCDDQFTHLLETFPGRAHLFPASPWTHPRPNPLPTARRMAAAFTEMRARAEAKIIGTPPSGVQLAAPPSPSDQVPSPEQAAVHRGR